MMTFVQGLDLSRWFDLQTVRPTLEAQCCGLPYAAALIGFGSGGLGLDTRISGVHHWGPRVVKIGTLGISVAGAPRFGCHDTQI